MAFISNNKPHKNTDAVKCGSKKGNLQRIYPTLQLFVELPYCAVNTADKIVGQTKHSPV